MRDILTGLAIVVIVLLTAALIGPHVVDWSSHRELVEKRLSELMGVGVSTHGGIAIGLLPTPTISLQDVTLGDPGASHARMKSLDVVLSLTSLLRGEVRVTAAVLDEPDVSLVAAPEGGLAGGKPAGGVSPANVIVERFLVNDGKVSLARPGQPALEASRFYVDAEASSLLGPLKGRSRFMTADGPRTFSFATGKYENGKLHVKALLEDEARAVRYDLDGSVAPAQINATVFSGQLAASGNIALARPDGYGQVLWRLQAPASATLDNLHLDNIDLTLGNDAGVKLTGKADVAIAGDPSLNLALTAKQVDLDRILSADPKAATEHAPVELIAALSSMIGGSATAADAGQPSRRAMSIRFDIGVGNAILAGDTITDFNARGLLTNGQLVLDRVAGRLPGATDLDASGLVSPMAGPRFDGQIGLASSDARRFLAWCGAPIDWPLRTLKAQMRASAAPGLLIVGANDVQVDEGRLSGVLERRVPSDANLSPILTATIKGSGLPLEMARLLQGDRLRTDIDLKLDLSNIKVGAVSAGQIQAHVVRTRAGLALDGVDVQNLAGLQLKGRSSLGQAGGGLLAEIDVRSLDSIVDMLQRIGYPNLAQALTRRSSALNGLRATIRGDSRVDGPRFVNTLQLDGQVGKSALSGLTRWTSSRTAASVLPDADISLHMGIRSPDSAEMLAQLGFETLRLDSGPAALDLDAKGQWLNGFQTKASGTVAGAKIAIEGDATPADALKPFDGSFSLETNDLATPARALAVAFPPVPQGMPAKLSGKVSLAGAKLALTRLEGNFGADNIRGTVAFDLAQNGRLSGELHADTIDARSLASIVLGTAAAPGKDGGWSRQRFGAAQPPPLAGDLLINTPKLVLAMRLRRPRLAFSIGLKTGWRVSSGRRCRRRQAG